MPSQNKQIKKTASGFTIIEVVLVLAIAGLIFLMVFVALPALQRSQRDTARRNDMSRVDTSLIQYQTNNQDTGNGDLPGPSSDTDAAVTWTGAETFTGTDPETGSAIACNEACKFVQRYMNSGTDSTTNTFKDPDGTYYSVSIGHGAWDDAPAAMDYTIYIRTNAQCQGEKAVSTGTAKRHFAILYRLEGAGVYCIDDQ